MYAVFLTGGKQYRVKEGDFLRTEKLTGEVGQPVEFSEVLLINDDGKVLAGKPALKKAKVVAEIVKHARGKKLIAFKHERRKRYRRKVGHRQSYTEIKIKQIQSGGE